MVRTFLPKETVILLIISTIVYISAVLAFVFLENKSLLMAIYFVIVTLSTVGFGDVVPTHPVTIILVMLLIVTGISTIALISQAFIDDVVRRRTMLAYQLPSTPIQLDNHVIIVGIRRESMRIAEILNDRFIQTVLVDTDVNHVIEARRRGLIAYQNEVTATEDFDVLNLSKARSVFSFLRDDNRTISLVLMVKEQRPDIPIFSSTDHDLDQKFGELIGITRVFHDEDLVASFINVLTSKKEVIVIPNQYVEYNKFQIILVDRKFDPSTRFKTFYEIARVNESIFNFVAKCHCTPNEYQSIHGFRVLAIPLSVDRNIEIEDKKHIEKGFRKIFVGGYSDHIKHIIDKITIENSEIDIITFDESEEKLAKHDGFRTVLVNRENIKQVVEKELRNSDLLINFFSKMTESILLTLTIRESLVSPVIYQFVENPLEAEVFKKLRVDSLFSPMSLKVRSMTLNFLRRMNMTVSLINPGHHIFEHVIQNGDKLIGKSFNYLRKRNYDIMLLWRNGEIFEELDNEHFKLGDSVILYRKAD